MPKKRPTNQEIIDKYLEHYKSSQASVRMRESSLNYFFGYKEKDYFDYSEHVFDIKTQDLINYFEFLKNLKTISLQTKKNKWHILVSFLRYTMEYYRKYDFVVVIPQFSIKWGNRHPKPSIDRNAVMKEEEVEKVLNYFKIRNWKFYLIFRCFAEWGARKGGVLSADYRDLNIKKRLIILREKEGVSENGECCYYFSEELADLLKIYLEDRKRIKTESKILFLSNRKKPYTDRYFNMKLKEACKKLGIDKNVTCHTFRKTINTLRKTKLDCPGEDRKILLCHSVQDVNLENYTKLDYENYIDLYDRYNPYKRSKF
ncbi:MAG: tyrosine-type recombinase/integrase [Promethearchaeota archaeon]